MGIRWENWGAAAFERAARERKAVVAFLEAEGAPRGPWEALWKELGPSAERFVWVRAGLYERPDIVLRYAFSGAPAAAVLSPDGRVLWPAGKDEGPQGLKRALEKLEPGKVLPHLEADEGPVWTGAVSEEAAVSLDPAWPRACLKAVAGLPQPGLAGLELLLYAAREWGDAAARQALQERLPRLSEGEVLADKARRSRLLWDAFAQLGGPALRGLARDSSKDILSHRGQGALLAHRPGASRAYGAENAAAALALLRAAAFEPELLAEAQRLLDALKNELYDPLLGVIHGKGEGETVYGLLEDNAWAALAFTEAFLITGLRGHREFADELGRLLFQELWERERGGFSDRVLRPDDVGLLKTPRLDPAANAVAFEAIWRLSELKGNLNYRRWVEMGLKCLAKPGAASPAFAGLARIQDMLTRGRLDLELVGRLDQASTRELLNAVHRFYLPRKVISFVDPDDQDYIQAHKLTAPDHPRLFACLNLKRIADTNDPAKVGDILKTLEAALEAMK